MGTGEPRDAFRFLSEGDLTPLVALAVIHAAHIPERKPLLERLERGLGLGRTEDDSYVPAWMTELDDAAYSAEPASPSDVDADVGLDILHSGYLENTQAKYWVWHERTLDFFAEAQTHGATHALTLQDDVLVSPRFWHELDALVRGRYDDVICLDCAHPAARDIFVAGQPGYTTSEGMIGIGHIEPMEIAMDFARWRIYSLRPGSLERTSEDILFGLYCMSEGIPIFCPVPSMIDHDLDVDSTNEGYDMHLYRKPQVTWKEIERHEHAEALEASMLDPEWWARDVPHLGRFYENAHTLLGVILKDRKRGAELALELEKDKLPKAYARFYARPSCIGA